MTSAFIPFTMSLDVSAAGEEAQAVASELLRRTNGLSPRISEDEALRILLVDITRDYLKAKSKAEQKTE
ncbi:hypothetical protein LWT83_14410 [Enterobacter hormaechei]|uniref:hypothetical protein n=1 Tax=Enterobacter hormaechei TaxID=158836 RepID=UPI001E4CFA9B|nr:hypothetical protein [Enterobacter hormaechei]MCC4568388.1 hypothetical protein [Enterobacter hormaechei subsp. hoffmannii]MCC4575504.1 hypothetical protein [Enterobacter hormaechei subsp. hoffmannii]MCC4580049.1 hypothetical protein [Enterobacter hormaechei subsp. hoffmannii]MCC4582024.1 hypothetical protein [Enterobacter hormaechei subsp. hoffmannii]MCE1614696.1 hypothetical protein [Enterobacter hormaechei]